MNHVAKVGRNDACPCGSRKKYKKCCEAKLHKHRGSMLIAVVVAVVVAGGIIAAIASFREDSSSSGLPGQTWSPDHGHYH